MRYFASAIWHVVQQIDIQGVETRTFGDWTALYLLLHPGLAKHTCVGTIVALHKGDANTAQHVVVAVAAYGWPP